MEKQINICLTMYKKVTIIKHKMTFVKGYLSRANIDSHTLIKLNHHTNLLENCKF